MAQQEHELLTRMTKAESLGEIRSIVRELERRFLYTWRAVGDNEANYGLINIGSDPGHALVERVTNAIDSVIEAEALRRLGKKGRDSRPHIMPLLRSLAACLKKGSGICKRFVSVC